MYVCRMVIPTELCTRCGVEIKVVYEQGLRFSQVRHYNVLLVSELFRVVHMVQFVHIENQYFERNVQTYKQSVEVLKTTNHKLYVKKKSSENRQRNGISY